MIKKNLNINTYINLYLYSDNFEMLKFISKKDFAEELLVKYTKIILNNLNIDKFLISQENEFDLNKLLQLLAKTTNTKNHKEIFDNYTKCILDIASYIQISQLIDNINNNDNLSKSDKLKEIYKTKTKIIQWDKNNNIRGLYAKNFFQDGSWYSISTSKNSNPATIAILTFLTFKENFFIYDLKKKKENTKKLKYQNKNN